MNDVRSTKRQPSGLKTGIALEGKDCRLIVYSVFDERNIDIINENAFLTKKRKRK